MTNATQTQPKLTRNVSLQTRRTLGQTGQRRVGSIIAYIILVIGGLVMIFPLFWMLTASFKPEWQVIASPPVWIPSKWIQAQAGNTTQEFPLYWATNPAGEQQEVLQVGVRRYTTTIQAAGLPELVSVPPDQVSGAQPTTVGNVLFNVRTWTKPDGSSVPVVALARDGDNLVVAPVDALTAIAEILPLDEVNAGKRSTVEAGKVKLQGRQLEDGTILVPLGPESQMTVVAPQEVAAAAILVPASAVEKTGTAQFGTTELDVYSVAGHEGEFIELSSEAWQPIISLDQLKSDGFNVENAQLSGAATQAVNGVQMPVATFTRDDGTTQTVAVLIASSAKSLVIPVDKATTLRLTPLGKLAQPFIANVNGTSVPYRSDYEEQDERQVVAIVGERQDMALVAPQSAVSGAFDVASQTLSRVLVPHLEVQNYVDALSKDLGGANFLTFFRNSAILVILSLIGHFFSVTLVAYAFARLRAPGKNLLFLILLSTMMLPFPVLLIPTYEIFQKLGMINTLWPLFIRTFFGNAFLIFLLRQFFMSIPLELEDAARIDGANTVQVLWHVMLPLSKPALATIGIFTFWWTWNAFFEPYVYLSSVYNFTVSLGLAFFKNQYTTSFHLLMAASMVVILPIITIFFFAQRYFIEGIQLTGLKG
jgi:ABC-type glycerol-3-phosphate transport system permease component